MFESFRNQVCYLNARYPDVVNGSCGIDAGTLGPDYFVTGLVDGWYGDE